MRNAYNPQAAHTTRRTTPLPDPHQFTRRRMCDFYSAGLPPQLLVKLQFWDRLCIDTRIMPQPIMPGTILRCDPHAGVHNKTAAMHLPLN